MMPKIFYVDIISKLLELSPDILLGVILPLVVIVITSILMWRYVRMQNSKILELQSKNEELKELLKNASNSAKDLFDELTIEKQKNKNSKNRNTFFFRFSSLESSFNLFFSAFFSFLDFFFFSF